eukprot:Rmarinus@m.3490
MSSSRAIFAQLGAGTRFNKKRFKKDFKRFNGTAGNDGETRPNVGPEAHEQTGEEVKDKENINALRNRNRIHIKGSDVPAPIETFGNLQSTWNVPKFVMAGIESAGFKVPTAIQMQAIPILLQGRDLIAIAHTGAGKTAAFAVPVLAHVYETKRKDDSAEGDKSKRKVHAVVLAPTRELAKQIHREFRRLGDNKVNTKLLGKKCLDSISSYVADVVVSTPLTLRKAIKRGLDLSGASRLVLDEVDKLFDLGFIKQIDSVISACKHPSLVTAMFSATIMANIEDIARTVMKDPVRVSLGQGNCAAPTVQQKLMFVGSEEGKLMALRTLFREGLRPPMLVFVQSQSRAQDLYEEVMYDGVHADVIHAGLTQEKRDHVVDQFRLGKIWVLIATDVMGRGMDFKGVKQVVNYDFPQTQTSYIHRIGRTGRMNLIGEAVTFFTEDDAKFLRSIVNVMRDSGCEVPEWMLNLKRPNKRERKKLERRPVKREKISSLAGSTQDRAAKRRRVDASGSDGSGSEGSETGVTGEDAAMAGFVDGTSASDDDDSASE